MKIKMQTIVMQSQDTKALLNMLEATSAAMSLVQGQLMRSLLNDTPRIQGIVKAIEFIDHSACEVTAECRELHPDVPWDYIIGLYDDIVQPGGQIDPDKLWFAVSEILSPLQFALERAAPPDIDAYN